MNIRYLHYSKTIAFSHKCNIQYSFPFISFSRSPSRHQSTNTLTPLQKYSQKVSEGKLTNDLFQRSIVLKLEKVYESLQSYKPPKKSFIWKVIPKKRAILNQPKGLYIYGAVGGGKTLLMDLFYSCCEVINRFIQLLRYENVANIIFFVDGRKTTCAFQRVHDRGSFLHPRSQENHGCS